MINRNDYTISFKEGDKYALLVKKGDSNFNPQYDIDTGIKLLKKNKIKLFDTLYERIKNDPFFIENLKEGISEYENEEMQKLINEINSQII